MVNLLQCKTNLQDNVDQLMQSRNFLQENLNQLKNEIRSQRSSSIISGRGPPSAAKVTTTSTGVDRVEEIANEQHQEQHRMQSRGTSTAGNRGDALQDICNRKKGSYCYCGCRRKNPVSDAACETSGDITESTAVKRNENTPSVSNPTAGRTLLERGVGSSDVLVPRENGERTRDVVDHGTGSDEPLTSHLPCQGSSGFIPFGETDQALNGASPWSRACGSRCTIQRYVYDESIAERPYSPSPREDQSFERLAADALASEERLQEQKVTLAHELYLEAEQFRPAEVVTSQGFDLCSLCQRPHVICVCGQGSENNNSDCHPDMSETNRSPRSSPATENISIHSRTVREWHAANRKEEPSRTPFYHFPPYSSLKTPTSGYDRSKYQRSDLNDEPPGPYLQGRYGTVQEFCDTELEDPQQKAPQVECRNGPMQADTHYPDDHMNLPPAPSQKRTGALNTNRLERDNGILYTSRHECRQELNDSVRSQRYYDEEIIESPTSQKMRTSTLEYSKGKYQSTPSSQYSQSERRDAPLTSELQSSSSDSKDVPVVQDCHRCGRNSLARQRRRSKARQTVSPERLPRLSQPPDSPEYGSYAGLPRDPPVTKGGRSPAYQRPVDRGPWGSHASTKDTISPSRQPDQISTAADESLTSNQTDRTTDPKGTHRNISSYSRIVECRTGPKKERLRYEKQKIHVKTFPRSGAAPAGENNFSESGDSRILTKSTRHEVDHAAPDKYIQSKGSTSKRTRGGHGSLYRDDDSQRNASPSPHLSSPRLLQENRYFSNEGSWDDYTFSGKRLPPPLTSEEIEAGRYRSLQKSTDSTSIQSSVDNQSPRKKSKNERSSINYPKRHDCGCQKDSFVYPERPPSANPQRKTVPHDNTIRFSHRASSPTFSGTPAPTKGKRQSSASPKDRKERNSKFHDKRRPRSASPKQSARKYENVRYQQVRNERSLTVERPLPFGSRAAEDPYFADEDSLKDSETEQKVNSETKQSAMRTNSQQNTKVEYTLRSVEERSEVAQKQHDSDVAWAYGRGIDFFKSSQQTDHFVQTHDITEEPRRQLEIKIAIKGSKAIPNTTPSSEPCSWTPPITVAAGKDSGCNIALGVDADNNVLEEHRPTQIPGIEITGDDAMHGPVSLEWFSQENSTFQSLMTENMEMMQRAQDFQRMAHSSETQQHARSDEQKEDNIFIGVLIKRNIPYGEYSSQQTDLSNTLQNQYGRVSEEHDTGRLSAECQDRSDQRPAQETVDQLPQKVEKIFSENILAVGGINQPLTELNIEREIFVREQIIDSTEETPSRKADADSGIPETAQSSKDKPQIHKQPAHSRPAKVQIQEPIKTHMEKARSLQLDKEIQTGQKKRCISPQLEKEIQTDRQQRLVSPQLEEESRRSISPQLEKEIQKSSKPRSVSPQFEKETQTGSRPRPVSPQFEKETQTGSRPRPVSPQFEKETQTGSRPRPVSPQFEKETQTGSRPRPVSPQFEKETQTGSRPRPVSPQFEKETQTGSRPRPVSPQFEKETQTGSRPRPVSPQFEKETQTGSRPRPVSPQFEKETQTGSKPRPVSPQFEKETQTSSKPRLVSPQSQKETQTISKSRPVSPQFEKETQTGSKPRPVSPQFEKETQTGSKPRPVSLQFEKETQTSRQQKSVSPQSEKEFQTGRKPKPASPLLKKEVQTINPPPLIVSISSSSVIEEEQLNTTHSFEILREVPFELLEVKSEETIQSDENRQDVTGKVANTKQTSSHTESVAETMTPKSGGNRKCEQQTREPFVDTRTAGVQVHQKKTAPSQSEKETSTVNPVTSAVCHEVSFPSGADSVQEARVSSWITTFADTEEGNWNKKTHFSMSSNCNKPVDQQPLNMLLDYRFTSEERKERGASSLNNANPKDKGSETSSNPNPTFTTTQDGKIRRKSYPLDNTSFPHTREEEPISKELEVCNRYSPYLEENGQMAPISDFSAASEKVHKPIEETCKRRRTYAAMSYNIANFKENEALLQHSRAKELCHFPGETNHMQPNFQQTELSEQNMNIHDARHRRYTVDCLLSPGDFQRQEIVGERQNMEETQGSKKRIESYTRRYSDESLPFTREFSGQTCQYRGKEGQARILNTKQDLSYAMSTVLNRAFVPCNFSNLEEETCVQKEKEIADESPPPLHNPALSQRPNIPEGIAADMERTGTSPHTMPVLMSEERAIPTAPPASEIPEVMEESFQAALNTTPAKKEPLDPLSPKSVKRVTVQDHFPQAVPSPVKNAEKIEEVQQSPSEASSRSQSVENRVIKRTPKQKGAAQLPMKNIIRHNPHTKQVFSPTTTLTVANHVYLSPQHAEGLVGDSLVRKGDGQGATEDLVLVKQPQIHFSDNKKKTKSPASPRYLRRGVIKKNTSASSANNSAKTNLGNDDGYWHGEERVQLNPSQSLSSSSASSHTARIQRDRTCSGGKCKTCKKIKKRLDSAESSKHRKCETKNPMVVTDNISCNNQPTGQEPNSPFNVYKYLMKDEESPHPANVGYSRFDGQFARNGRTPGSPTRQQPDHPHDASSRNSEDHMISEQVMGPSQASLMDKYRENVCENNLAGDRIPENGCWEQPSASTSFSEDSRRQPDPADRAAHTEQDPQMSPVRTHHHHEDYNHLPHSHQCMKAEKLRRKLKEMKKQQLQLLTQVKDDCVTMVDKEIKVKDAQLLEERMSKGKLKDAIVTLQKQLTELERESWRSALSKEVTQQTAARDKSYLESQLSYVQSEASNLRHEKEMLATKLEGTGELRADLERQLTEARAHSREKDLISSHQAEQLSNYRNLVDLCHDKYQEQRDMAIKLQEKLTEVTKRLEERNRESGVLRQQLDKARGIITKRRRQVEQLKRMQIQLRVLCRQEQSVSAVAVKEKKSVEDKLHLETTRYSSLLAQVDKQNERLINVRSKMESLDPSRLKLQYETQCQGQLDHVLRYINDILQQRAAVAAETEMRQQEMAFQQRAHEANLQILQERNEQLKMMKEFLADAPRPHKQTNKKSSPVPKAQDTCTERDSPVYPKEARGETPREPSDHDTCSRCRHIQEHCHFLPHSPHTTQKDPDEFKSSRQSASNEVFCEKRMLDIRLESVKNRARKSPRLFKSDRAHTTAASHRKISAVKAESKSFLASIKVLRPSSGFSVDPVASNSSVSSFYFRQSTDVRTTPLPYTVMVASYTSIQRDSTEQQDPRRARRSGRSAEAQCSNRASEDGVSESSSEEHCFIHLDPKLVALSAGKDAQTQTAEDENYKEMRGKRLSCRQKRHNEGEIQSSPATNLKEEREQPHPSARDVQIQTKNCFCHKKNINEIVSDETELTSQYTRKEEPCRSPFVFEEPTTSSQRTKRFEESDVNNAVRRTSEKCNDKTLSDDRRENTEYTSTPTPSPRKYEESSGQSMPFQCNGNNKRHSDIETGTGRNHQREAVENPLLQKRDSEKGSSPSTSPKSDEENPDERKLPQRRTTWCGNPQQQDADHPIPKQRKTMAGHNPVENDQTPFQPNDSSRAKTLPGVAHCQDTITDDLESKPEHADSARNIANQPGGPARALSEKSNCFSIQTSTSQPLNTSDSLGTISPWQESFKSVNTGDSLPSLNRSHVQPDKTAESKIQESTVGQNTKPSAICPRENHSQTMFQTRYSMNVFKSPKTTKRRDNAAQDRSYSEENEELPDRTSKANYMSNTQNSTATYQTRHINGTSNPANQWSSVEKEEGHADPIATTSCATTQITSRRSVGLTFHSDEEASHMNARDILKPVPMDNVRGTQTGYQPWFAEFQDTVGIQTDMDLDSNGAGRGPQAALGGVKNHPEQFVKLPHVPMGTRTRGSYLRLNHQDQQMQTDAASVGSRYTGEPEIISIVDCRKESKSLVVSKQVDAGTSISKESVTHTCLSSIMDTPRDAKDSLSGLVRSSANRDKGVQHTDQRSATVKTRPANTREHFLSNPAQCAQMVNASLQTDMDTSRKNFQCISRTEETRVLRQISETSDPDARALACSSRLAQSQLLNGNKSESTEFLISKDTVDQPLHVVENPVDLALESLTPNKSTRTSQKKSSPGWIGHTGETPQPNEYNSLTDTSVQTERSLNFWRYQETGSETLKSKNTSGEETVKKVCAGETRKQKGKSIQERTEYLQIKDTHKENDRLSHEKAVYVQTEDAQIGMDKTPNDKTVSVHTENIHTGRIQMQIEKAVFAPTEGIRAERTQIVKEKATSMQTENTQAENYRSLQKNASPLQTGDRTEKGKMLKAMTVSVQTEAKPERDTSSAKTAESVQSRQDNYQEKSVFMRKHVLADTGHTSRPSVASVGTEARLDRASADKVMSVRTQTTSQKFVEQKKATFQTDRTQKGIPIGSKGHYVQREREPVKNESSGFGREPSAVQYSLEESSSVISIISSSSGFLSESHTLSSQHTPTSLMSPPPVASVVDLHGPQQKCWWELLDSIEQRVQQISAQASTNLQMTQRHPRGTSGGAGSAWMPSNGSQRLHIISSRTSLQSKDGTCFIQTAVNSTPDARPGVRNSGSGRSAPLVVPFSTENTTNRATHVSSAKRPATPNLSWPERPTISGVESFPSTRLPFQADLPSSCGGIHTQIGLSRSSAPGIRIEPSPLDTRPIQGTLSTARPTSKYCHQSAISSTDTTFPPVTLESPTFPSKMTQSMCTAASSSTPQQVSSTLPSPSDLPADKLKSTSAAATPKQHTTDTHPASRTLETSSARLSAREFHSAPTASRGCEPRPASCASTALPDFHPSACQAAPVSSPIQPVVPCGQGICNASPHYAPARVCSQTNVPSTCTSSTPVLIPLSPVVPVTALQSPPSVPVGVACQCPGLVQTHADLSPLHPVPAPASLTPSCVGSPCGFSSLCPLSHLSPPSVLSPSLASPGSVSCPPACSTLCNLTLSPPLVPHRELQLQPSPASASACFPPCPRQVCLSPVPFSAGSCLVPCSPPPPYPGASSAQRATTSKSSHAASVRSKSSPDMSSKKDKGKAKSLKSSLKKPVSCSAMKDKVDETVPGTVTKDKGTDTEVSSPTANHRQLITEREVSTESGARSSWITDFLKAVSPPTARRQMQGNGESAGHSHKEEDHDEERDPFVM